MQANRPRLVAILLPVVLVLALLGTSAVASPAVGTADEPILLSVVEGVDVDAVEGMAVALEIATGLHFEVEPVELGAAGIEWLCDLYPDRGLRLMPDTEYILAREDCRAKTSMTLNRFSRDRHRAQFVVPFDSGLSSLEDLAGLDWYYPDESSTSGYVAPLHMLMEAGVEGFTGYSAGGHTNAVLAVYDNALDPSNPDPVFATVFEDARAAGALAGLDPSVFDVVTVLEVSPYMLFEAAAFGPGFPDELRKQIEDLMWGFSDEAHPAHWVWEESLGSAYNSNGWVEVRWPDYHFMKGAMETAEFEF